MKTLVLSLLIVSYSTVGFSLSREAEIAESPQWHRLMHYLPSFPFGKIKSQVDGSEFFFSPEGKTNPLAELQASVEAFSKTMEIGKLKQHPQCAFPARFAFLKKELGLQISEVKCPLLEDFMKRVEPHSVTLVFSSAYPNNPGSMFGHTFLRINRKTKSKEKKMDILDYGISFAASVGDDENPLAFIVLGLTGGYRGQFSSVPYYVKVNEYSNAESRDVWEYDLNLNEEETRSLVNHVWEIETNSYFDYYFFDENCAYELMTLLEVAKPEWNISNFPIYVIPSETVKKVTNTPGAVTHVRFRPSLRKKMLQKAQTLSSPQKEQLKSLLSKKIEPETVADPFVLDAAIANLFYEKQEKAAKFSEKDKALQASLLIQRSKMGKIADAGDSPTTIEEETRPDLGHYSYRASLSPGYLGSPSAQDPGFFQEVGIKSAYHDLLNKDLGFIRNSQIDFPNIYFRYYPERQAFQLEKLELLHITSLFPLSFIEKRPSWKVQLGYLRARDLNLDRSGVFRIETGLGASIGFLGERNVLYFLALGYIDGSTHFIRGFRLGPKLQLASILNPFENYKTRLSSTLMWDLFQSDRPGQMFQWDWEHALSLNQSWEARLSMGVWHAASESFFSGFQEAKLSLNYYF
ncbi:MAG: DUF4105 domain-containing protein [Proteobacteria bacterium]|nr:DUF4105 domain-containing protein [Pseudomonadota bacterium]